MIYIPAVILLLLFVLSMFFVLRNNTKKSNDTISLVDQKIKNFKNRSFVSTEEKEIAKKELISELIHIKDKYSSNHVSRGYLKMSDIILSKISLL